MPRITKKIKEDMVVVRQEIEDKTAGYIVTALGLVAGLAWNNAIQALIDYFFPANKSGSLWARFIYAIILTLVVVLVSYYVVKILRGNDIKKELEKENKTGSKKK